MKTVKKIWLNGKLQNWKDAKVHVLTHSLHYGSGVFEGIRFYKTKDGPAIFLLKEHIKRLFFSAKCMNMNVPYKEIEIEEAVVKLIKANKISSGYIRPLIYYGYGKMGLNPIGAPVDVMIAIWPWGSYLGDTAIKVHTSKFIRIHPKSTYAQAKICGHYVNSIVAHLEAKAAKTDEAILLDYKGNIAEGPGENFFMVKNNIIYTPKKDNILQGLTRETIIKVGRDLGYKVIEKDIKPKEVKLADEVFFTGTAAEVTQIGEIDGKKVMGGKLGPVTEKLKTEYMGIVQGKNPKYTKWLTLVS